MTGDTDLDCEGMLCPLPVLKARKVLLRMAPGDVLTLRTTDPMAVVDLPHFCAGAGHDHLELRQDGPVSIHLIRRGK